MAIRTFAGEAARYMEGRCQDIQHENIISAKECYRDGDRSYFLFDDLPITLEHLVACDAYPSDNQLASVLVQVRSGRSAMAERC